MRATAYLLSLDFIWAIACFLIVSEEILSLYLLSNIFIGINGLFSSHGTS